MITVSWDNLKQFVDDRSLSVQWVDANNNYYLKAFDGSFQLDCILNKNLNLEEISDFETNYKDNGNKKLSLSTDVENATIQRLKMAHTGWTYKLRGIEFETSLVGGIDSFDVNGIARNDISATFYDVDGNEILHSDPVAVDNNCVKTVIDWEPSHDYELIGGTAKILEQPESDIHFFCIAVPDIPYEYGGSRIMIDGVNFRYIGMDDKVQADGRVSKRLYYSAINHTNKLRFIVKHAPGANHKFLLLLEFFKP